MTPGFAALLYGWIYGKSPASVEELIASKLLRNEELKHANGTPIAWRPGETPRSAWGTPSALTPLIDLSTPDTVTEPEKVAYERFSRTYESYWSGYIDPAMLDSPCRERKETPSRPISHPAAHRWHRLPGNP